MKDIVLVKNKEMEEMAKKLNFEEIVLVDKNIMFGKDENFNRKFLETNKNKILFDVEPLKKDSLHQRDSGLNEVLCKLAKNNNIVIGFSLKRLLNKDILLLGKIIQNIELCNKYKLKIKIASLASSWDEMRSVNDIISLGRLLGIKGNFLD